MPIIDTTYGPRQGGFGGLPAWTCTFVATFDPATVKLMELYAVPRERLKMTVLPNRRELAVMRTDGQPLVLCFFTPSPYLYNIVEAVKIGPLDVEMITGVQATGDYAGFAICRSTCVLQQTKANDYAP